MDPCLGWRAAVSALLVCVAAAAATAAEPPARLSLQPKHAIDELVRVELALQVEGDLTLVSEGKKKTLPMKVRANLGYDEQLLAVNQAGLPVRSLRFYDDVRAEIEVAEGGEKPKLAKEHRLIVASRPEKSPASLFCPVDMLKREELDLIDVPANSLVLDALLPEETVTAGQSWKLTDQALADLLCLEAVSWSHVECMVAGTADGLVNIDSAGSVSGAVGGVSTEIELKMKYRFHQGSQQITYLALLIKEKRSIGHIGPGLDTTAKMVIQVTPLATSENLSSAEVKQALAGAIPDPTRLVYQAPGGAFRFTYDRRWYVISDDSKLAVLRMLDRGDPVAQCNVSALPKVSKQVALAEFQNDVKESLGKNFGQFISASQTTTDQGYALFRVVVQGVQSQLPIEWVYYLIANEKGQRVTLAFTYEQSLREQFAQADRQLASQIRLTDPPMPTAARPVQAR